MSNVKAIETQYQGYLFRSRLEARWAVFFDALGIEWRYEPEGYELPDGTRYLPDFWLPSEGKFAEVKHDEGSFDKANAFVLAIPGVTLLRLAGTPDFVTYDMIQRLDYCKNNITDEEREAGCNSIEGHGTDNCYRCAFSEHSLAGFPSRIGFRRGRFHFCISVNSDVYTADERGIIEQAIIASRSARFEFSSRRIGLETPRPVGER
jgi:hypothetical protein